MSSSAPAQSSFVEKFAEAQRRRAAALQNKDRDEPAAVAATAVPVASAVARREVVLTFKDRDDDGRRDMLADDKGEGDGDDEAVDADLLNIIAQRALRRRQEQRLRGGSVVKTEPPVALDDMAAGGDRKKAKPDEEGIDDDFDEITAARLRFAAQQRARNVADNLSNDRGGAADDGSAAPKFLSDFAEQPNSSAPQRSKLRAKFAVSTTAKAAAPLPVGTAAASSSSAAAAQRKPLFAQKKLQQHSSTLHDLERESEAAAAALRERKKQQQLEAESSAGVVVDANNLAFSNGVDAVDEMLMSRAEKRRLLQQQNQHEQPASAGSWTEQVQEPAASKPTTATATAAPAAKKGSAMAAALAIAKKL
jgi:hypothetical protein